MKVLEKNGHAVVWGDAMEALANYVPDGSVDLIFADPLAEPSVNIENISYEQAKELIRVNKNPFIKPINALLQYYTIDELTKQISIPRPLDMTRPATCKEVFGPLAKQFVQHVKAALSIDDFRWFLKKLLTFLTIK